MPLILIAAVAGAFLLLWGADSPRASATGTDIWTTAASVPGARRDGFSATTLPNGKVLLAGGTDSAFAPTYFATSFDSTSSP